MSTRLRSYAKINLGLAIGPVRPDGFHGLTTLYQTLDLHDVVTVSARPAGAGGATRISLTTNHPFVPRDARNTAWRMVERCLTRMGVAAEVSLHIEKNLPVQGGLGAGSANAAAALLGLERELGVSLPAVERLLLAAEIGSDVPLFLLGGAVLGLGRGELVVPMPDLPPTHCVVAVPSVGVSTPQAFRDWDARVAASRVEPIPPIRGAQPAQEAQPARVPISSAPPLVLSPGHGGLTGQPASDRLNRLSLAYASLSAKTGDSKSGTSGILHDPQTSEKKQGVPERVDTLKNLAENTLLALVRTGIGSDGLQNDFEEVVFPQYPSLRTTKRQLMGSDSDAPALYAALSGSGSALFGLYRSESDAKAAQRRVQSSASEVGVRVFLTETLQRADYWTGMFAS